jgi:hypothetical protein
MIGTAVIKHRMLCPDATIGVTTLDYCAPTLWNLGQVSPLRLVFFGTMQSFSRLVKWAADATGTAVPLVFAGEHN